MLVILKIGYQKYILPNEQGLQTVLRCLGKASPVEADKRYMGGGITTKGICDIECEILPPSWKLTDRKAEVLVPEIIPSKCQNEPFTIHPNRRQLPGRRALPPAGPHLPPGRELLLLDSHTERN